MMEVHMLRRHEDELMNRLDHLYVRGWVEFNWDELCLWYPTRSNTVRGRITRTVYSDILERWNELTSNMGKEDLPLNAMNLTGCLLLTYASEQVSFNELATGEKAF
jgi:hypothetical protein